MIILWQRLLNLLVNQVTSQEWGLGWETLTMQIRPLCHLCNAANLNQAWRAHPSKYPTFFSSPLCCCNAEKAIPAARGA